jgi:hypothetical protein
LAGVASAAAGAAVTVVVVTGAGSAANTKPTLKNKKARIMVTNFFIIFTPFHYKNISIAFFWPNNSILIINPLLKEN